MRADRIPKALALLVLAAASWPAALPAANEPLELVETVDLERYQGLWYEIARLPNWFQDQCAKNVRTEYTLLENGKVKVVNRCQRRDGRIDRIEGVARRPEPEREAALEVRFAPRWLSWLPFLWGDYQIMALSEDYQSVLVGTPSRKYLWILARGPSLPEARIRQLLAEAGRQGFDTEAVTRTRQD